MHCCSTGERACSALSRRRFCRPLQRGHCGCRCAAGIGLRGLAGCLRSACLHATRCDVRERVTLSSGTGGEVLALRGASGLGLYRVPAGWGSPIALRGGGHIVGCIQTAWAFSNGMGVSDGWHIRCAVWWHDWQRHVDQCTVTLDTSSFACCRSCDQRRCIVDVVAQWVDLTWAHAARCGVGGCG